ncbi:uncharacterized protein LOC129597549 [Paramacrobiotus metropolitanus]|uniref:uncharacterized protein LOC129597549 n=1 Tax=Paramacrobiotus metropolitanus TaxID=2943436 RepID=UPI00244584A9|nr:uncharacterized protein LOC129597549 [Paramacrobiotus metropolitanus]
MSQRNDLWVLQMIGCWWSIPKVPIADPSSTVAGHGFQLFSVKDGWVDTTLEYIESEVCAPGPCCYENVTKTPDFPPGFVPNYRKSATTGTTLSTTTTTTSQESVDEQKQGLSTGIIVAIAVGGGVACLYMLWSWDLLLLPTSKFKPTKKEADFSQNRKRKRLNRMQLRVDKKLRLARKK